MKKGLIIAGIFGLWSCLLPAGQAQVGPGKQVNVIHADLLEVDQSGPQLVQRLKGNVELRQDSVFMYCDTAVIRSQTYVTANGNVNIQQSDSISVFADSLFYDGLIRQAELTQRVVLINGPQRLFTRALLYDLNTDEATYQTTGLLDNGRSQLSSKKGRYLARQDLAIFKDSVVVVDSLFTLRADSLRFNTKTETAYFSGPTRISQNEGAIYCESGYYDIPNQQANFSKNAQYKKEGRRASADRMQYDGIQQELLLSGNAFVEEPGKRAVAKRIRYLEREDVYYLEGNAYLNDNGQEVISDTIVYDATQEVYTTTGRTRLVDSTQILEADLLDYDGVKGEGFASGAVYWQDTSRKISIKSSRALYRKNCEFLLASGTRPLFITEMEGDSLFMTADTLESSQICTDSLSGGGEARHLKAYHDVRIFKSNLQGICDSMRYSTQDSLFVLFYDPLLWSDTSQFLADTISIQMANNQIDRIYLNQNAMLINSSDKQFFNQVKGRHITAYFRDNDLYKMRVVGNAEAIYFIQDELGQYVGPNKVASSDMWLFFENHQITDIKLYNAPSGDLLPMQGVRPGSMELEGFRWEESCRPASLSDLLKVSFCDL